MMYIRLSKDYHALPFLGTLERREWQEAQSSLLKTTFLRIKMKHPGVLHYDWTKGRLAHIAGEGTLSYEVNG